MSARAAILVALCLACTRPSAPPAARPVAAGAVQDVERLGDDLRRELETTVLENYLQLGLGNFEAYADSMARDRDVVLMGIRPGDSVAGINPRQRVRDRRLFRDRPPCVPETPPETPCLRLVSKHLTTHLYADDSVGWIADEISYRVPHQGREAAIPLRMTAVMVRDIDRWALVLEHVSYSLSAPEIVELARGAALARLPALETRHEDRNRSRLVRRYLLQWLNAGEAERNGQLQAMERRRQRVAQGGQELFDERAMLVLLPGMAHEYRGARAHAAPSLAELFGPGARVELGAYRFSVAANKRVAWMAAHLAVTVPGAPAVTVGLRGTFLFVFDSSGWTLMQAHISAPVTEAQVRARFFGP